MSGSAGKWQCGQVAAQASGAGLKMAGSSQLQVAGSKQCGQDGMGQERVRLRVGSRWQARDSVGQERMSDLLLKC